MTGEDLWNRLVDLGYDIVDGNKIVLCEDLDIYVRKLNSGFRLFCNVQHVKIPNDIFPALNYLIAHSYGVHEDGIWCLGFKLGLELSGVCNV